MVGTVNAEIEVPSGEIFSLPTTYATFLFGEDAL